MNESTEWYVGLKDTSVGPVSTEVVIRGVEHSKTPLEARVCRVGETAWSTLAVILEDGELSASIARSLAGLFAGAAGPDRSMCWIRGPLGTGKTSFLTLVRAAVDDPRIIDRMASRSGAAAIDLTASLRRLADRQPIVVPVAVADVAHDLPSSVQSLVRQSMGYSNDAAVASQELVLERAGGFDDLARRASELGTSWADLRDRPEGARLLSAEIHRRDPRRYPTPLAWLEHSTTQTLSARDAAESIVTMRKHRGGERPLLLLLDDADRAPAELLRPLAAHLAAWGKGLIGAIATSASSLEPGLAEVFPLTRCIDLSPSTARRIVERVVGPSFGADVLDILARITWALDRERPGTVADLLSIVTAVTTRLASAGADTPHDLPLDAAFDELAPAMDRAVVVAARASSTEDAEAPLLARATAAIALLQTLAPATPVDAPLLTLALRGWPGSAAEVEESRSLLRTLEKDGRAVWSPAHGHEIVTPHVGAWCAQREQTEITNDEVSEMVSEKLSAHLVNAPAPRVADGTMRYVAVYADGRRAHDERIFDAGGDVPALQVDFRHMQLARRAAHEWKGRTLRGKLLHRLVWVAQGDLEIIRELGTALARSRRQVRRGTPALGDPPAELGRLLVMERSRRDDLDARMRSAVEETFLAGTFFVRGTAMPARSFGSSFGEALAAAASAAAPTLLSAPIETTPLQPVAEVIRLRRGTEVASIAELEAVFRELTDLARPYLERGKRVRID